MIHEYLVRFAGERSGLSDLAKRLLKIDIIYTLTLVRRGTCSLLLPTQNSFHVRTDPTTIFEGEIGLGCRVPEFYRDGSGEIKLMSVKCLLRLGYCKGTSSSSAGSMERSRG